MSNVRLIYIHPYIPNPLTHRASYSASRASYCLSSVMDTPQLGFIWTLYLSLFKSRRGNLLKQGSRTCFPLFLLSSLFKFLSAGSPRRHSSTHSCYRQVRLFYYSLASISPSSQTADKLLLLKSELTLSLVILQGSYSGCRRQREARVTH